jgi:hypothetical protein
VIFPSDSSSSGLVFTADLGDDEELYADAWDLVQDA